MCSKIGFNLDGWKSAGYWPRHRMPLNQVEGSVLDWGVKYFSRIPEPKLRASVHSLVRQGGTLFLHGPRGTGKTQFAAYLGMAVAVMLGDDGVHIEQQYWSWPELIAAEKLSFDDPKLSSRIGNARTVDLLVLDEIQEETTEFSRHELTRLIDHRYGHLLRTVLIANLDADAIPDAVGTSAYSRLCETGAFLEMSGEPYR